MASSTENAEEVTARCSGADALVRVLESQGIRHVFGLCGHTNVAVLAALERSPIRFVGVHHEQMASHAADGLARLTGGAQVVLTHLGPGLTNALTGVANASLDSVPMVVISGNVQSYFFGRHAHMETLMKADADQARAYDPWCKRIWRVERPEALVDVLDAAFATARCGRPGPVLVDVAMDVFSAQVDMDPAWTPRPVPAPPGLTADIADAIATRLEAAKRPVVYAGGEVVRSGAGPVLAHIAELLGAPIAYSLMGKGAVSDRHPLCAGMTGFWGTPAANFACARADVVLAVGTSFTELDTSSWTPGLSFAIPPTELIHTHVDPSEIGRSYRPAIGAVADALSVCEEVAKRLEADAGSRVRSPELPAEILRLKDDFDASLDEARRSDAMPMRPERVLYDLRTVVDEGVVIVGDTGWNKNGIGQQVPVDLPGRLVLPGGYSTMGFGPSAALGAALGAGEKGVLALVGDGAFLTNLSVIITAVEERIPVVWAIMDNGTYATISSMESKHFGTEYGAGFDTSRLDYVGIAAAAGARGYRVDSPEKLLPIVQEALGSREPCVIDVPCTRDTVPTTGRWEINDLFARAAGVPGVTVSGPGHRS